MVWPSPHPMQIHEGYHPGTRRKTYVGLMLGHRRRRFPSIKPT